MRGRVAAGAVGAVVVVASAAATPEAARWRAEEALTQRFGASTVGSAEPGWGRLALTNVHLAGLGSFERVEVDAGLVDLAVLGASAVTHVSVSGCEVDVDLDAVSTRVGGPTGEGDARPAGPDVDLEDCRIAVHDASGPLVSARRATIARAAASIRATLEDVRIAADDASVRRVEIAARREPGGPWALAALELDAPRLRAEAPLRQLLDRARGRSDADPEPDPEAAAPTPALASAWERYAARTTSDAVVRVVDGELRGGDPDAPLIEAVSATFTRDGDRIATAGSGRPSSGGTIDWDLTVTPVTTSAAGSVELDGVPLAALAPFLPDLPLEAPESTLVSATIELGSADESAIVGSGSVTIEGLALSHPRIAPTPVRGLAVTLRGRGEWRPADGHLRLDELALESGGAALALRGAIEWTLDHYLFDLHAELPTTSCQRVVDAIPDDLLGDLSSLRLDGRISGVLDVGVDSRDLEATTLSIAIDDRCTFVSVPPSAEPGRFRGPFVQRVVETDGDEISFETGPGTERWAPLASISPFVVHAVLAHEDAGFFRHHGFATWAIREALIRNLREGRYVMGASTITMQLVKNVFLHREKTLARKIQEVLLTWWVESVMPKDQILELYLNVIELGPHVYGIREGAEHWFGRAPGELSVAEAVYLACILPNPSVYGAEHRPEGAPPASFRRRMRNLLRHLAEAGRIDDAALESGLAEIDTMTFHRPGDPPPAPRMPVGRAAALPIEGWGAPEIGFGDESAGWDEPVPTEGDTGEALLEDGSDDAAALDDTVHGWDELP